MLSQFALPLTELALDGESERAVSGGGLETPSGFDIGSCDIPGSCLLLDVEPVCDAVSSWLRLYAAEPMPLSAVCLNQEGSLAPRDWAILSRETFSSSDVAVVSGVGRGDRAALFSAATTESGLRPPEEVGRRCHESVPVRVGTVAALGDAGLVGSAGVVIAAPESSLCGCLSETGSDD